MNRIFHARVGLWQCLHLALVGALLLYLLWHKHVLLALVFMLWLIVTIEKLIHTTYTLTSDGHLELFYGRFWRGKQIPLARVTAVQRVSLLRLGRVPLIHYVLLRHGAGRRQVLFPVKEEEFVRLLEQRR